MIFSRPIKFASLKYFIVYCEFSFFYTRYVHFVQEQGLRDSQCMLFAHQKPGANGKSRSQIRKFLS